MGLLSRLYIRTYLMYDRYGTRRYDFIGEMIFKIVVLGRLVP